MRKGWKKNKLSHVCAASRFASAQEGSVPYVEIGDVNVYTKQITLKDKGAVKGSVLAPSGSLLVSKVRPTRGAIAILELDSAVSSAFTILKPQDGLDLRLLFYGLAYSEDFSSYLGAKQTGLLYPSVKEDEILSYEISYPTCLQEQGRIVGILDEAFAGLATAKDRVEKICQNARALFESHSQALFAQRCPEYGERPLGDLCEFLNGFAFKSFDSVRESQTQLVRMGNLYGNQLDLNRSPVFYPDSFATEYSRYVLTAGDIIMSLTGTTGKEDYGFAVRIPDCGHTLLMNQRIMKFDAVRRDIIDDGYLLHYLRSRCFLDILYPTANGTRQANLSSVTMKSLPVPLRSPKDQKFIAAALDDLREETQRLASLCERKLAALETLKTSLLREAFNGNL